MFLKCRVPLILTIYLSHFVLYLSLYPSFLSKCSVVLPGDTNTRTRRTTALSPSSPVSTSTRRGPGRSYALAAPTLSRYAFLVYYTYQHNFTAVLFIMHLIIISRAKFIILIVFYHVKTWLYKAPSKGVNFRIPP